MYLGFNYDLARGKQDELLRWAENQRKSKRVRFARSENTRRELSVARSVETGPPIAESTGLKDLRAS